MPVVLLAILLVNQVFNPARIWVGVMLALAVMLGLAYLWARQLRDHLYGALAQRGTWILAGDLLSETFTVENRSSFPALGVEVVDHSNLPGYQPDWVASVDVRGSQSYARQGRCQRRGVFTLGPWELRTGDPLGIFSVSVEMPDTHSIMIYPRAMVLPDLQLPRGEAAGAARTQRPSRLYTTTVASVRPYVPGDPLRAIHWRQTAHHGQFMVKEFDLEPSGDLWIALDLDANVQRGEGARSTLEYAITLTASLATEMLAENRRVGLAAQGYLIPPQPGQMQLWRILEALARVEPVAGAPAARLLDDLRQTVGRGRTVVVITPSAEPIWVGHLLQLANQGNAPAALLLDASSFAQDDATGAESEGSAATAALRAMLAEQGVPSHVIDSGFEFRPVHTITRTRTELRTLSATGRVIRVEVSEEV
ncbi:MAG: DUF58 domain-containing protein [Caldilineales bacterium]